MNNKLYILALVLAVSSLTACKKVVEGYNADPNNPQDADAITMLTSTEISNVVLQEGELARHTGLWNGYFTGEQFQYQSIQQYLVIAQDFNASWQLAYASVVKNARLMKQKALALNNRRLVGVAQLLEANAIGTTTALWGDVPFAQAANDAFPNPVFDAQSKVYAAVQTLLDSAILNFASTAFVDFTAQDIHFGANMTKWTQTAYTLKARYYMHTRQYPEALAAATNGISSAANNWLAPHSSLSKGTYNLYYQFLAQDRPGFMDAAGAYVVGLLNSANSNYRGNAKTIEKARFSYLYSSATNPNYTTNGFFYLSVSYPMASYAENLLTLTEADFRVNGFTAGLARLNTYRAWMAGGGNIGATYLTAGNYKYDAYVAADFNAGGIENAGAAPLPADRALLREIMEERYVSFIGQVEGYNDTRRIFKETDIRIPVPPNAGAQFPQRFLYPQTEIDLNKSTVNPIPGLFEPTPVNK
ncbi:MAG: SusD/RagB family nutrient-binding outer membrane lipoprotein [Bacteroidetes bacterium]|nr:SusD/RagB family nutrient-binding outer membrane lipoprotein [Bacteroidota bacterium]